MTADPGPLGRNLRAWRERVRPEEVGLPGTARRRTPGLRREELATLAGVSPEYVVRLEQGRTRHPSPQVVSAMARALGLSPFELDHLYRLAGLSTPESGLMPRHITPGVRRLVDRLGDSVPIAVCTSSWETVYWNPLWAALLGDPAAASSGRERNFAWRHFTGLLTGMSLPPDTLAEFEHDLACDLRRTVDRYPGETDLAAMCQELRERFDGFARSWDSGDVPRHRTIRKIIEHDELGSIAVDSDILTAPDSELYVTVLTAEPGSEDASRLSLVLTLSGWSSVPG
ncbi:helix-turn-helix transcriptional regulator [Kribbella sp. NBC_01505]|uniref:helix-turn-helix domain-containing protein n=1 Tax=Kribbella sp. NBC_01505 TaxID=2903580 RepID=UPI003865C019